MSKPDSTGESLESILASIRRSLAEQATDILEDESASPADALDDPETITPDDGDVPRLLGEAGADAPPADADAAKGQQPSSRFEEDPPPPPPGGLAAARPQEDAPPPAPAVTPAGLEDPPPPAAAAPATASSAARPPRDPLWFLSGRGETEKKDSAAEAAAPLPHEAPSSGKAMPLEPKPPQAEVVRGPLPPFFGSSAEAAKVEPGISMDSASAMPPIPLAARPLDGDPVRGAAMDGAPRAPAWPGAAARDGVPSGRPSSLFGPAATGAPDTPAQLRGLEAMVAELLRPMLRRWLDENMPRLVSAALKAEAELISRRDPKKP